MKNRFNGLILSLLFLQGFSIFGALEQASWSRQIKLGVAAAAIGMGVSGFLLRNPSVMHYLIPPLKYPKKYSIHLMWINKRLSPDQTYVYPAHDKNNFGDAYADTIIKWAKENPEATVNLWFDSTLVSDQAIRATHEHLSNKAMAQGISEAKIQLMDVRQCEVIKNRSTLFTPKMPVFWRADFARAVVIREELERDKDTCCVYADLDVVPLSKKKLFDRRTLEHLEKHNFVMAYVPNTLRFENGFQICTHDETLLKAMDDTLINMSLARAEAFVDEIKEKTDPNSIFHHPEVWNRHEAAFQENTFYLYPLMHAYLGQLKGLSHLTLRGRPGIYDPNNKEMLDMDASILMAQSSARDYIKKIPIPSKKVAYPPTTSKERKLAWAI